MDVSPEVYRDIVRSVSHRSDIAALARVCKGFQPAAERALYNTLIVSDADPRLIATLASSPRLASLVVALTVQMGGSPQGSYASSEDMGSESLSDTEAGENPESGERPSSIPASAWISIAGALRNTTRLRHLTIDIANVANLTNAWVLAGCQFQLHTFHCDFDWDHPLRDFLATQKELHDLFIRDYVDLGGNDTAALTPALPSLSTLECTFTEAAAVLAPLRPVSRLKTCFSHSDASGRRAELTALLLSLRLATAPIHALDIADSIYTEAASMELLHRVTHTAATTTALRYLSTLALPVGGRKRLHFYGLLMRLPQLRCLEVDISAWTPPPTSSPALRALAAELRLYCPAVTTVVFVYEFERTVVTATAGGVLKIDEHAMPEHMWREV